MKYLVSLTIAFLLAAFTVEPSARAQEDAAAQQCDGPEELCDQLQELRDAITKRDAAIDAARGEVDEKVREAEAKEDAEKEERMKKVIGTAAVLAVALRMLLSMLASWKDYFKTDQGKAWLKLVTIVVGLLAFVAGNMGFGLPWWQALILAGGGPASMAVHSVIRLIPALKGKAKYKDPEAPVSGDAEKTPLSAGTAKAQDTLDIPVDVDDSDKRG